MFEGGNATKLSRGKAVSISLSKSINASAQKVCDHWLIPVFVGEWMFGAHVKQEKIVQLKNEVRKGGSFSFTVNQRGTDIQHSGSYLELDIPNRLVFSWTSSTHPGCESQITVQFLQEKEKTKLKITIKLDAELGNFRDEIKREWTVRCNALAEKFEKQSSLV